MRVPSRSAVLTALGISPWIVVNGLLLALTFAWTVHAQDDLTGRIVIAGYGPELPVLQDLARAFEKHHPGTAVDFNWDKSVRAVELVKRGEAKIAVTDQPSMTLSHTQIAWDGIAVIVNFANPIKEVTTSQVRALLTGQIIRWSDLDGSDVTVDLLPRSPQANLSTGLESALGVSGKLAGKGHPLRNDQQALSAVSGQDTAVTYLSLNAALKAQEDGISIRNPHHRSGRSRRADRSRRTVQASPARAVALSTTPRSCDQRLSGVCPFPGRAATCSFHVRLSRLCCFTCQRSAHRPSRSIVLRSP